MNLCLALALLIAPTSAFVSISTHTLIIDFATSMETALRPHGAHTHATKPGHSHTNEHWGFHTHTHVCICTLRIIAPVGAPASLCTLTRTELIQWYPTQWTAPRGGARLCIASAHTELLHTHARRSVLRTTHTHFGVLMPSPAHPLRLYILCEHELCEAATPRGSIVCMCVCVHIHVEHVVTNRCVCVCSDASRHGRSSASGTPGVYG